MDFSNCKEANLFDESDCEINGNFDQGVFRKRHRKHSGNKNVCNNYKRVCQNEETNNIKADIEHEQNVSKKESKDLTNPLWSIEDTLFYPLGIRSHYIVGINKSVLLIWSEISVINFVIKKNPKTKQTKTTRVRIFTNNNEEIEDIRVLEFNTLVLLKNGRMNFFSSSKSMHTLPWLDHVRCFAAYSQRFSVIRLNNDRKLELQIYDDVVDMGKQQTGPLKQKYDITFDDENIFNCDWTDEQYYLLSTVINESNLHFLELLTRNAFDLKQNDELHLFAISGNVFALLPDVDAAGTYNIEMLFSYSSNVAIIKLDFEKRFCFIFLQCGVIDIWYLPSKQQYLRHQTYSIGVEHTSFSYSESRAALYFSDGDQVAEFRFSNANENDELILNETYKAIPGILACTWIEAIEQLICLDCNNIFHQICFETVIVDDANRNLKTLPVIKTDEYEKFNTLFELTPQRVEKLLKKANIIQELNELPKNLYIDIDQQFKKQQLLAISNKFRYYSTFLIARLEYCRGPVNTFPSDLLPLYTQIQYTFTQRSVLALIYVEIKSNEIFQHSLWQLHLKFEGFNHVFTLPKIHQQRKLCLVVPFTIIKRALLPEFKLHMQTFVSFANNFVTISLPISIALNGNTFVQLFSGGKSTYRENICSQYSLENVLAAYFNKERKIIRSDALKCCLSVPKNFELSAFLKNLTDELFNGEDHFELDFLGSQIVLQHDSGEDRISLQSNDAAALLCVKTHLQLICQQPLNNDKCVQDNQQQILRYQTNVEQLYGMLQNVHNEDSTEKSQMVPKIKLLIDLYSKVRKDLVLPMGL